MNSIIRQAVLFAGAAFLAGNQAIGASGVRIITPTSDLCRAYTEAMLRVDKPTLLTLSSWYIGFLAGVAQGTGVDFLRNQNVEQLNMHLFRKCRQQPDTPMSVAAEEIANGLVASKSQRK